MLGRPFLWSALNQNHYDQRIGLGPQGYYRDDHGGTPANHSDPRSAFDVLEAGHAYLLPEGRERTTMNASPFWPLVWKEYRAGRAFWLAMVTIALLSQASVCWRMKASPERNRELYTIALFIAAGFMVGVGVDDVRRGARGADLRVRPTAAGSTVATGVAEAVVCPGGLGNVCGPVVAGRRRHGRLAVSHGQRCQSALDPLGCGLFGVFGLGDFFLLVTVEPAESGGAGDVGGPGGEFRPAASYPSPVSRHAGLARGGGSRAIVAVGPGGGSRCLAAAPLVDRSRSTAGNETRGPFERGAGEADGSVVPC